MRTFTIEDFTEEPCKSEWQAYQNAQTDAERASVVLRNYAWICDHSVATIAPLELVRECLQAGADVDDKDSDGRTALMRAAGVGDADCVRLLIEAGADVEDKDSGGRTALMRAARYNHTDCVRLLIEAGADVDDKDSDGWTALMRATEEGDADCVRLLIEAGAKTLMTLSKTSRH